MRCEQSVLVLLLCALLVARPAGSKSPFDRLQIKTTTPRYSPGASILGIPAGLPPPPSDHDVDEDLAGPHVECPTRGNCTCSRGYVGTPPTCMPGLELWSACFLGNKCGPASECELDDADAAAPLCACMKGHVGCPPKCRPGPTYLARCAKCGANTECDYAGTTPTCYCLPGYVGEYDARGGLPRCTPGRDLLAKCSNYTHGPYADCQRRRGGACSCSCLPGYEGKPPDCRPGPELWRVCFKDRPCGPHSLCTTHNGAPVCNPCSAGYAGKPPNCYQP